MGHEDYRTTAEVYEQDIDDSATALAALETIMGCTLTEAHDTFSRRGVLHPFCTPGTKKPAEAGFTCPRRRPEIWLWRGSCGGAAEGTRTLDLLHGKQTL